MAEKTPRIFVKGILTFPKNERAPDFVVGNIVINLQDFKEWVNDPQNAQYLTEYQGKKQLRLTATTWEKKLSISVDTFKPQPKDNRSATELHEANEPIRSQSQKDDVDSLPF